MGDAQLEFAPGLYDVLTGDAPPTIEFLKSLPQDATNDMWADYALVLEKDDAPTLAYFGSGTRTVGGLAARFKNYDDETVLPVHVAKALADGYTVVSKGVLVTSPHPRATSPYVRCLLLAMEATFTFLFNGMLPWKNLSMDTRQLCPWSLDQFEYEGLCSHNSMIETPAGFEPMRKLPRLEAQVERFPLTAEEQAAVVEEYTQKRRAYYRAYHADRRVTDPDYYRKKRAERALYVSRHPERVAAADKRMREKNKAEGRFPCEPCGLTFLTGADLRRHEGRQTHQDGVDAANGVVKEEEVFHCDTCDKMYPRLAELNRHYNHSKEHQDNLAKAAGTYKEETKNWDKECNKSWPHTGTYKKHLDSATHKNAVEAYKMRGSASKAFAGFQPLKRKADAAPLE